MNGKEIGDGEEGDHDDKGKQEYDGEEDDHWPVAIDHDEGDQEGDDEEDFYLGRVRLAPVSTLPLPSLLTWDTQFKTKHFIF